MAFERATLKATPDPSAAGRRGHEAQAKARGLQGDEKCPGCDGEQCTVVKKGLVGKASDGKQGLVVGKKWYCSRHGQRLRGRLRSRWPTATWRTPIRSTTPSRRARAQVCRCICYPVP